MVVSADALIPVLAELGFDVDAGLTYCGSDADFYCDLIRELHEDALVRRGEALAGGDARRRREYAHLLKGTLQVLGETRASQSAKKLEQALRNSQPEGDLAQTLLNDLDRIDLRLGALFSASSSAS